MKTILTLLLVVTLNGYCHEHHHEHEEEDQVHLSDEQIQKEGIQIQPVKSGVLSSFLSARGKIVMHPDGVAHLSPKISGVAREAKKNVGDKVSEGEVLAVLECHDMGDVKAGYLTALEKEKLCNQIYESEKRLHDQRISPKQDFYNAKSALEEAKINVRLTKQKLCALGVSETEIKNLEENQNANFCSYEIRSPLNGTLINRHITIGENIKEGETVYEVADLSRVWVEIAIFPAEIASIKVGQIVKIIGDDKETGAKIIYVSPVIEDASLNAKAIAEIKNPNGVWRPGTFVKVSVATDSFAAHLVIPKEALQQIEDESVVFVRNEEGFEKRPVKVGRSDEENVEILSGLKAGEKIATSKTFLLKADLGKNEAEHEH